jgi:hypothetical protein
MVRPRGLEPPTSAFGGRRSIQLSYGRMLKQLVSAVGLLKAFHEIDQDVNSAFGESIVN